MKLVKLIILSFKAFKIENELSISYIFGKKLKNHKYLINREKKFEGTFFGIISFLKMLFLNFSFYSNHKLKSKDVLIFASTSNQLESLNSTIKNIKKKKFSFELLLGIGNFNKLKKIEKILFSPKIIIVSLILFIKKSPILYMSLSSQNNNITSKKYFNLFCQVYAYIPYFLDLLHRKKIKFILVSNDHNESNRSIRLAAEILNIKTIYIQHASITRHFPPLEFDYALLDGNHAKEKYITSLNTNKKNNPRVRNNTKKCKIILSGQKKIIYSNYVFKKSNLLAGVAVNNLDEFDQVEYLLSQILKHEKKCIIRTHPSQFVLFIKKIKKLTKSNNKIIWSNPDDENILNFLSKVKYIISADSSIHLEAGLAKIPTFCYKMNKKKLLDQYAYVKNGLSFYLGRRYNLKLINEGIKYSKSKIRQKALKKYSATFGTDWQNKEGILSLIILKKILNDQSFDDLFKTESSIHFHSIRSIK